MQKCFPVHLNVLFWINIKIINIGSPLRTNAEYRQDKEKTGVTNQKLSVSFIAKKTSETLTLATETCCYQLKHF